MDCKLVLSTSELKFKDYAQQNMERLSKLDPMKPRGFSRGATLAPSCGICDEFDILDFENEMKEKYANKIKRVTSLFLRRDWKTLDPLARFRCIAKAIVLANRWKISYLFREEETATEALSSVPGKDHLRFNVELFRVRTTGNATLTKKMEYILMKDGHERTQDEIDHLALLLNHMKCFSKYSPAVRRELAGVMNLEKYERGRVITKEGTPGMSVYYLISGRVDEEASHTDQRTGEKKCYIINELSAGSSFGELALVQDCTRTSTIISKEMSQFLRIDRSEFELAVQRSYEKEWRDKLHIIKSMPYFSGWSGQELRHIILNCFIQHYEPDSLLFGNTDKVPENIYFLYKGTCTIVRQVDNAEVLAFISKDQTMMSSLSSCNDDGRANLFTINKGSKNHFLNIGQLGSGDYFGVGEDLVNYYFLAKDKVECLLVPRHAVVALERILKETGHVLDKKCCLEDMKKHAQSRLLSLEEVMEKWITNIKWKHFKAKTLKEAQIPINEKKMKKKLKRFCLKDFTLPHTLPSLADRPLSYQFNLYPVSQKAGFLNRRYNECFPPIKSEEDEKRKSLEDMYKHPSISSTGRKVGRKSCSLTPPSE